MARKTHFNRNLEETAYLSSVLNEILSCLRAQSLSYQTSHWQSQGSEFYQQHLLFERLYNSVEKEIDDLAEKIVGYTGSTEVGLGIQTPRISDFLRDWDTYPDHVQRGLQSENTLQDLLYNAFNELTERGLASLGLEDWLAATASAHETNIYLLQQSAGGIQKRKNPRRRNPYQSAKGKKATGMIIAGTIGYFLGKKK